MLTIADELLADILAAPADDGLRLIFADWLEENGQEERAELIRVQVELAREEARAGVMISTPDGGAAYGLWLGRLDRLRRRERALVDARGYGWCDGLLGPSWWPVGLSKASPTVTVHFGDHTGLTGPFGLSFRRGFVASVSCTLTDWLAHGPAIVRAQPVEEVRLSGTQPYKTFDGWWGWSRLEDERDRGSPAYLPPELFDLLPEGDVCKPPIYGWDSEARAFAALWAACLLLARG